MGHETGYLVTYRADNRHLSGRYWNASQYPAPRTVILSDFSVASRYEDFDPYRPEHVPLVGERVFVDLDEAVIELCMDEDTLKAYWESGLTSSERKLYFDDDFRAFCTQKLYALERDMDLGASALVTVTKELANERNWR